MDERDRKILKWDLEVLEWEGLDRVHAVTERDKAQALVNTAGKCLVP
jgi:hypothetical protein